MPFSRASPVVLKSVGERVHGGFVDLASLCEVVHRVLGAAG